MRVLSCLVPRPHYSARPKRFGSRGPIENVFPDRSPRIGHRNELTERDWKNAVQGLGKGLSLFLKNVVKIIDLAFLNLIKSS